MKKSRTALLCICSVYPHMYQVSRCSRPCHVTAIDDHLGTWAVAIHGRRDRPAFRAQIGRASLCASALPLPSVQGWGWACTATPPLALSSALARRLPSTGEPQTAILVWELGDNASQESPHVQAQLQFRCFVRLASSVAIHTLRPHGRVVKVSISYKHFFVYKRLKLSRSANPSIR